MKANISYINSKLVAVKSSASVVVQLQTAVIEVRNVAVCAQVERIALRARLDEAEDQYRRDNLIFVGVTDTISETWAQTEERMLSVFRTSVGMPVTGDSKVRAHRLLKFYHDK